MPAVADPETSMKSKRNDVSTKIDADVLADARVAASFKGMNLAEYISETLRPIVQADIEDGYRRRMGAPSPSKPRR